MGFLDELRVDQEVAHTRLLAWLLKPDGDHELRSLVLSAFWRRIGLSKSRKGLSSATVRIEQRHEKTIPDIVITTQGVYVLIENKIRWPAFNQQQIERHAKSGKRKAAEKKFKLVLLLPDDTYQIEGHHHSPAIRKIRRDFHAEILSWNDIIQEFRRLDPGNGLTKSPGLSFVRAYREFVEREIFKKWKGFNMQLIDKNSVTALSTYLGRRDQLLGEFRNFAESVRAGLGPWREAPYHESREQQPPNNLRVYSCDYRFRRYANTVVELSFWVDENAHSRKGLKLWLGFWTNQKDVMSSFAKQRLLTRGAANSKLNSPFKFLFEATDQELWFGHFIPQRQWLTGDEKIAAAGVKAVAALLRQYLKTTENLLGKFE
jgi:hypothetical protein